MVRSATECARALIHSKNVAPMVRRDATFHGLEVARRPTRRVVMKKFMTAGLFVLSLGVGMDRVAIAQQTTATDEAKKAGEATKDAGKDTGEAAKHAGKATAKATEKGAKKVKKAVTGDAHATCVDGTVQAGKTEAAAATGCKTHGGVAKK
jgi:hypothetical protein